MAARKRIIHPGGTRGTVFRQVAQVRLDDASILLKQKRFAGAIYLAGYAAECLLKWAVTRRLECVYLPADFEIHDLAALLRQAGLEPLLLDEAELRDVFWALADTWGPELRYLAKSPASEKANSLYQQIARVYDWIVEQTV